MLIAARNAMLAGGGLSAKSYVQDGLVAMWDGIENAGWGTHNGSATTWTDLSGNNYNMSLNQHRASGSFVTNGIVANNSTNPMAVFLGAINFGGSSSYIECVFSFSAEVSETWGAILALGKQARTSSGGTALISALSYDLRFTTSSLGRKSFVYGVPYGLSQNITSDSSAFVVSAGVHQFRGSPAGNWLDGAAANGQVLSTKGCISETNNTFQFAAVGASYWSTTNPNSGGSFIGQLPTGTIVHAIRIYSQPLSSEQMDANYAVDKARFNLT